MLYDSDLTKDEFLAQQEFEDKVIQSMFAEIPLKVRMGSKIDVINHIAETAIRLYEGALIEGNEDKTERNVNDR